jgi:hypothetical protein
MSKGGERQVVYRLPKLYRFLIAWFFLFLLLAYDPIGEGPYKDRMLVGLVNYLAAPAYPSKARDQIVLVMADTVSLSELDLSWPLPFAEQADVIGKILKHEPRVLAMDLLFLDSRGDEGLDFLVDTVTESRGGIPIIGAAAPAVGAPAERRQILPLSIEANITVRTDWHDIGYRLLGDGQVSPPSRPSLALAIYQEACNREDTDQQSPIDTLCASHAPFNEADFEREMLVFWGTGAPDYSALFQRMDIADDLFRCVRDSSSAWERVVRMFVRQESAPRETCAFHPVLPLDLLMRLDDDVLDAALGDKIVIYGIDHPGIPDVVNPPTSHPIPGVHLHAMALDNLLTFGSEYFGTVTAPLWGVGSLALPTLKFVVASFMFVVIFALLLSSQTGKKDRSAKARKKKTIRDFDDVKDALWLVLQRIGPTGIARDVADGLAGWNRRRDVRLRKAGHSPRTLVIWVAWFLGLLPVLVGRTSTGRVVLFVSLCALIVYLDIHVLMVPPINALTLLAILFASQLVVPAGVFSPRRRRRRRTKGAKGAKAAKAAEPTRP